MLDIMYKLNDVIINRVCDFLKACTTEFKLTLVSLGGVMSPVVHHRLYEHFTIRKLWYKDTLVQGHFGGSRVSWYQSVLLPTTGKCYRLKAVQIL